MYSNPLRYEIIEPANTATACVIWLHGLGANGHDFVPVVPHLNLPKTLGVRFVFPHAPEMPVTCNGGYVMPAWYDIYALTEIRDVNLQHLQDAAGAIHQLIQQQIEQGIAPENIVLIGFSQGGAVAYHTALQFPQALAGLIALSTYLPKPESLKPDALTANKDIPIHIAHGDQDDMVTEAASRMAFDWLKQQGYCVDWTQYPMGHEVCISEIHQIGQWICELLPSA